MTERTLAILDWVIDVSSGFVVVILILILLALVGAIYITYVEKKNSAWLNQRKSSVKAVYSLKSIPFLYNIQTRIANKFAITNTGSRQENEKYALYVMGFILLCAIGIVSLLYPFVSTYPYAIILICAIGLVIPWMLFTIFYEAQLAKMIKQLPQAIDEFASSYRKSNKVFNALRDSYQYMPRVVGKEFERLYKSYNIDFEDGIEYFRARIKNDWAGIFASLLLINYSKGGTIISQLDDLNTEIENDIIAKDRVRSKMLGFKLVALSTLALVVLAIFANMLMSESAKEYYMGITGQNEIIITLTIAFITFLCMMLVEKL